jgi:protein-S-isoprenylcysteine O-methyltransferase Ste14
MQPQNPTPNQDNQPPTPQPTNQPSVVAHPAQQVFSQAPASNPSAVNSLNQQTPAPINQATEITAPPSPAAAQSIQTAPVAQQTAVNNDSQQLPSVTPPSSPLATPPNIPQSQLKEYLAQQASNQETANEKLNNKPSFELMIVALQFLTIAFLVFDFFSPLVFRSTTAMVAGSMLIGLGTALAIWARASFKQHMKIFPSPGEKSFLVTGGPYSLMRHPTYSGVLLVGFGLLLVYPSVLKLIAFPALVFIILVKIKYEEKLLANKFSGYTMYQENTGKLIPKIGKG